VKIRLPKPKIRVSKDVGSNVLIVIAMGVFVAFGATYGLRWALLAGTADLIVLGMAVGA
jgi:hypothetical protein